MHKARCGDCLSTAIELAVISKYLGSDALAVFGIVDLATSVTEIIGTGIGAAEEAMVAQSIGSGDYYRAGSIVQLSVWLYILLAIRATDGRYRTRFHFSEET